MQKEASSNQELNLKKRARRRLVGAIALVLIMIIVLPMLLKDRAADQSQNTVIITLPNEQLAATPATVTPSTPSDFDSSIIPTEPATPAADASESLPVTQSTVKTGKETPTSVSEAPATEPTIKPAKIPETKSETKAEIKPDAKPAESKKHQFYVQIGVFSDEANVKQLQAKLSDLGYKSQTEKINTDKGQKIRLKTPTFSDRNEAAIALQNIKDAGLTGMVVSQ